MTDQLLLAALREQGWQWTEGRLVPAVTAQMEQELQRELVNRPVTAMHQGDAP